MASIDDVPATQNLLHEDEKDDVDVEGEGRLHLHLMVQTRMVTQVWQASMRNQSIVGQCGG